MSESIYERLKNGESLDDIMNALAAEANEAQARLELERQEEEAAKKEEEAAAAASEERVNELCAIMGVLADYLREYYPALLEDEEIDLYQVAKFYVGVLDNLQVRKTSPSRWDWVFNIF